MSTDPDTAHRWPGGRRCVAVITVDVDGEAREIGRREHPLGKFSHGRYSARAGVPRYLRMLDDLGIRSTFFVPGHDAEIYPDMVRDIVAAGHEVAAHGYLHEGWDPGDAEPQLLRRSHDILTGLIGREPRGWRSPGGAKSERTLRTLADLGYLYDSSEKDYDLPFRTPPIGDHARRLVVLPNNTSSLDDYPFYRVSFTPPSEVLVHWIEEWEATRAEGGFFHLTVHPRCGYGSGTPARANVVRDLVRHIQASGDASFVTLEKLALWCAERSGAFERDWQREAI